MRFKALEIVVAVLLVCAVGVGVVALAAKQKTKTVTRTVTKTKVVQPHFSGPESLAAFLHATQAGQVECPPNYISEAVCFRFEGNRLIASLAFVP